MGITFKEDVSDIRNSKVFALIKELQDFGIQVTVVDPHANPIEVSNAFEAISSKSIKSITSNPLPNIKYDAIILAVGHKEFQNMTKLSFEQISINDVTLFDIKGTKNPNEFKNYWRL
jgi:UDP-N-acetyl-D-galactosamine dehydrogenase